ncbi:hypothetical protein DMI62_17880 [Escherichia coli]|nr:hypothetical protein [Escherichia coli]
MMADDPSPSAAMPDEHRTYPTGAAVAWSRRSLMSWRRPALAGGARAPGDRGYAKSSRPVYHAGDRPSL